jgi:hypothetical protein
MFLLSSQCALPRRWATWAALTAALAPGVEVLVSLCYLSHALCAPVLVAFLAGVIRLARGGGWRPLAGTVATFILGFSLYTEFAPLFAGTAGVALAAGLMRRHIGLARPAGVVAALVLSLGLNLAAVESARVVWERGTTIGANMTTGHRTAVWVAGVWLHFEKAAELALKRPALTFSHAVLDGCVAAAALGCIVFVGRAARSRRRLLPSLACAALLLPPATLWSSRPESAYIIGKLVITLTPILVLFIACATCSAGSHRATRGCRRAIPILAGGFLVLLGVQSGLEQWTWLRGAHGVGPAQVWNDPDLQHLCAALRERAPADVAIVLTNDDGGQVPAVACAALGYYARHHRIRLVAPSGVWTVELVEFPTVPRTILADLRAGTLVVLRRGSLALPDKVFEIVFENDAYQLICIGESDAKDS